MSKMIPSKIIAKCIFAFLLPIMSASSSLGQTRILTGKVIGGELWDNKDPQFFEISGATILSKDSTEIGKSIGGGFFEIELPGQSSEIVIGWMGMRWEHLKIPVDCKNVEVILIPYVLYHYKSYKKELRKIKKEYKDQRKMYKMAFEMGIFNNAEQCFQ